MNKYKLVIDLAYADDYYVLKLYRIDDEDSEHLISTAFDGASPNVRYIEHGAWYMHGFISGLRQNGNTRLYVIHSYARNTGDIEPRFKRLR